MSPRLRRHPGQLAEGADGVGGEPEKQQGRGAREQQAERALGRELGPEVPAGLSWVGVWPWAAALLPRVSVSSSAKWG